jgi:hypothetical protein
MDDSRPAWRNILIMPDELPDQPVQRSDGDPAAGPFAENESGGALGLGGSGPGASGDHNGDCVSAQSGQGTSRRITQQFHIASALSLVACGNPHAEEFITAVYRFYHVIDDLVDQDKPIVFDVVISSFLQFNHRLIFNPFLQANRDFLWPIMHDGIMAWWESEQLRRKTGTEENLVGHVLKSSYQNLAFAVAFVCGGLDHEMRVRNALRYVDFDD